MADVFAGKRQYMRRYRNIGRAPATPSQRPSRVAPFGSTDIADIASQLDLDGRFPFGFARSNAEVTTGYEARPVNCIDFVSTVTQTELDAMAGQSQGDVFYTVPQGRVAVVRRIGVRTYLTGANPRDAATGAPAARVRLDVFVGEDAQLGFTPRPLAGPGVRIDDSIVTPTFNDARVDLDTYFLLDELQVLRCRFVIENAPTWVIDQIQPTITGQLLLKKGIDLNSEPGNTPPV